VPPSALPDSASRIPAHIEAARGGSLEALGWLLERYRPYLLRAANAQLDVRLKAKGSGSDLVQETFLEAQRAFARFHGSTAADLTAWLHAILANKVATFTRRYRDTAKRQVAREVALDGRGPEAAQPPPEPEAPAPDPGSQLMRTEQVEALNRALEHLPEHYRRVIHWRQWEGLSFDVIAGKLGRSTDAARMLWWRAIDRLQRELRPS
jgi:RNA polymerase sigma-70 factor (ECF subfamily)